MRFGQMGPEITVKTTFIWVHVYVFHSSDKKNSWFLLIRPLQECHFSLTTDDDAVRSLTCLPGDRSSSHPAPLKVRTHHVCLGGSALQIAPNIANWLITWVWMGGLRHCKCNTLHGGDWWTTSKTIEGVEGDTQPKRHHSPLRMSHSNVPGPFLNRCTSTSLWTNLHTDSRDQKKAILLNMNTQAEQKMPWKLELEWTLFYFAWWQLQSAQHVILSCRGSH